MSALFATSDLHLTLGSPEKKMSRFNKKREYNRLYHLKHLEKRHKQNRIWCKENKKKCNEKSKKFYRKHRIECINRAREWDKNHKKEANQRKKTWEKMNPEKTKHTMRKYRLKKFGLSIDDYETMLKFQNNSCAICLTPIDRLDRSLCLDHDHKTGVARGLLCHSCNSTIGFVKEDVNTLQRMIKYIERYKK